MRLKNIIIQLGFMAISTPLLILLFNYLAQTLAPVLHSPEHLNNITPHNMAEVVKAGIVYQAFRVKFVYLGTIAGLIVGRAAYHLWNDR